LLTLLRTKTTVTGGKVMGDFKLPVAVIGAGPFGVSTAAYLLVSRRGIPHLWLTDESLANTNAGGHVSQV
jgi:threonine dehydrogenase-like Zn-dependent dehydrogenase